MNAPEEKTKSKDRRMAYVDSIVKIPVHAHEGSQDIQVRKKRNKSKTKAQHTSRREDKRMRVNCSIA